MPSDTILAFQTVCFFKNFKIFVISDHEYYLRVSNRLDVVFNRLCLILCANKSPLLTSIR